MSAQSAAPALPFQLFVGIDISAKSFSVSLLKAEPNAQPQRSLSFDQSPKDFARLEKLLSSATTTTTSQILIVMEATSTYWLNVAVYLHQAGFLLCVLNPAQAHFFAKSQLKRVKTDAVDAASLALFARAHKDELSLKEKQWNPPPQIYYELHQRLQHRDQLLGMRQQLKNQLHALKAGAVVIASVRESMEQLISQMDHQLKQLEKDIKKLADDKEDEWAKTITLLQTIPGIGLMSAALLVAVYSNFTNCPNVQAATQYAGLAPNEFSSGSSVHKGGHIGNTGNAALRKMLYMATLSAARYNPVIKEYYEARSKTKQGSKPVKVVRCGAARKLLHLAYAVATKQIPFDAAYYLRQKELRMQPKVSHSEQEQILEKAC